MKPNIIKIISTIFTVVVTILIAGGGIAILSGSKGATKGLIDMGVGDYLTLLGIMHIVFAILFIYPKTSRLGFLLLCCYLGGAIATELSHGQKLEAIFPLILVWIAAFLRDRHIFLPTHQQKETNKEV